MAKVTGPLMSLDASGTVGKTATFSKWNGRNYVRLRVIPMNPQTDAQNLARVAIGSIGKATAAVRTKFYTAYTNGSQFYIDAVGIAPTGQSWNSHLLKVLIGVGQAAFSASHTEYTGLGSTPKSVYDTAADAAGIQDFSFGYGSITSVTKGEMLYMLVGYALSNLGYTLSAGTLDAPDAGGLSDFVSYLQDNVV